MDDSKPMMTAGLKGFGYAAPRANLTGSTPSPRSSSLATGNTNSPTMKAGSSDHSTVFPAASFAVNRRPIATLFTVMASSRSALNTCPSSGPSPRQEGRVEYPFLRLVLSKPRHNL